MNITSRNGLPTKASLYRLADSIGVSFNSLDNRAVIDSIAWVHSQDDKMALFADAIGKSGFTISNFEKYQPSQLQCGHFSIGRIQQNN
jgi:hypothetical protein